MLVALGASNSSSSSSDSSTFLAGFPLVGTTFFAGFSSSSDYYEDSWTIFFAGTTGFWAGDLAFTTGDLAFFGGATSSEDYY